ncbi:hypothetical protein KJ611_04480 [Patescibacteria group bacterium]|nr:hypothetical protein [Patescibacteria group bacterium]
MTKFLIVILSVVVAIAIVAWILSRRERMIRRPQAHQHPTIEESPSGESQAKPVMAVNALKSESTKTECEPTPSPHSVLVAEDSAPGSSYEPVQLKPDATKPQFLSQLLEDVHSPEMQPQVPIEPALAVPHVPSATSPVVPLEATIDTTFSANAAIIRECKVVQSPSVPKQIAGSNDANVVEPSGVSQCEPFISDTKTPVALLETAAPASESAAQPAQVDEKYIEADTSADTAEATVSKPLTLPTDEAESDACETAEPATTDTEPTFKPPTYQPLTPPTPVPRTLTTRESASRPAPRRSADLGIRLQLVFGRGGIVKTLALVPDRRDGMPGDVEITGIQGELRLTELRDNCYEPVPLPDAANVLQQGIEWRGRGDARRWRWVMGGRELYVLAPGDEFGLHGFVSTARLWLNARHAVLATENLREDVLAALANVGCVNPEVCDDQTSGVPTGWILFREVTPRLVVPMRNEQDLLNALCPAHEIEPHFIGGIRLERNTWLAGFPPRIRLTGELGGGFQVMIDGQPAQLAADGAFEVPGWDAVGEHRLWFGDRYETYSLRTIDESWDGWHAHDFGTGAAICGAGIHQIEGTHCRQVRVPASNPLLIGARPGEIFCCQAHDDIRSETIFALVPFSPVWALPIDTLHADKRTARIVLLNAVPPIATAGHTIRNRNMARALRKWVTTINDARHKQLALAEEIDGAKTLWRHYCVAAKQLWRRMR